MGPLPDDKEPDGKRETIVIDYSHGNAPVILVSGPVENLAVDPARVVLLNGVVPDPVLGVTARNALPILNAGAPSSLPRVVPNVGQINVVPPGTLNTVTVRDPLPLSLHLQNNVETSLSQNSRERPRDRESNSSRDRSEEQTRDTRPNGDKEDKDYKNDRSQERNEEENSTSRGRTTTRNKDEGGRPKDRERENSAYRGRFEDKRSSSSPGGGRHHSRDHRSSDNRERYSRKEARTPRGEGRARSRGSSPEYSGRKSNVSGPYPHKHSPNRGWDPKHARGRSTPHRSQERSHHPGRDGSSGTRSSSRGSRDREYGTRNEEDYRHYRGRGRGYHPQGFRTRSKSRPPYSYGHGQESRNGRVEKTDCRTTSTNTRTERIVSDEGSQQNSANGNIGVTGNSETAISTRRAPSEPGPNPITGVPYMNPLDPRWRKYHPEVVVDLAAGVTSKEVQKTSQPVSEPVVLPVPPVILAVANSRQDTAATGTGSGNELGNRSSSELEGFVVPLPDSPLRLPIDILEEDSFVPEGRANSSNLNSISTPDSDESIPPPDGSVSLVCIGHLKDAMKEARRLCAARERARKRSQEVDPVSDRNVPISSPGESETDNQGRMENPLPGFSSMLSPVSSNSSIGSPIVPRRKKKTPRKTDAGRSTQRPLVFTEPQENPASSSTSSSRTGKRRSDRGQREAKRPRITAPVPVSDVYSVTTEVIPDVGSTTMRNEVSHPGMEESSISTPPGTPITLCDTGSVIPYVNITPPSPPRAESSVIPEATFIVDTSTGGAESVVPNSDNAIGMPLDDTTEDDGDGALVIDTSNDVSMDEERIDTSDVVPGPSNAQNQSDSMINVPQSSETVCNNNDVNNAPLGEESCPLGEEELNVSSRNDEEWIEILDDRTGLINMVPSPTSGTVDLDAPNSENGFIKSSPNSSEDDGVRVPVIISTTSFGRIEDPNSMSSQQSPDTSVPDINSHTHTPSSTSVEENGERIPVIVSVTSFGQVEERNSTASQQQVPDPSLPATRNNSTSAEAAQSSQVLPDPASFHGHAPVPDQRSIPEILDLSVTDQLPEESQMATQPLASSPFPDVPVASTAEESQEEQDSQPLIRCRVDIFEVDNDNEGEDMELSASEMEAQRLEQSQIAERERERRAVKEANRKRLARLAMEEKEKQKKEALEAAKRAEEQKRLEQIRLEEVRREEIRQEEIRQEEIRQEEIRQEEIRQEEIRQEQVRQEEIRQEQVRLEEVRQEELRQEQLRLEQLRLAKEEKIRKKKELEEKKRKEELVKATKAEITRLVNERKEEIVTFIDSASASSTNVHDMIDVLGHYIREANLAVDEARIHLAELTPPAVQTTDAPARLNTDMFNTYFEMLIDVTDILIELSPNPLETNMRTIQHRLYRLLKFYGATESLYNNFLKSKGAGGTDLYQRALRAWDGVRTFPYELHPVGIINDYEVVGPVTFANQIKAVKAAMRKAATTSRASSNGSVSSSPSTSASSSLVQQNSSSGPNPTPVPGPFPGHLSSNAAGPSGNFNALADRLVLFPSTETSTTRESCYSPVSSPGSPGPSTSIQNMGYTLQIHAIPATSTSTVGVIRPPQTIVTQSSVPAPFIPDPPAVRARGAPRARGRPRKVAGSTRGRGGSSVRQPSAVVDSPSPPTLIPVGLNVGVRNSPTQSSAGSSPNPPHLSPNGPIRPPPPQYVNSSPPTLVQQGQPVPVCPITTQQCPSTSCYQISSSQQGRSAPSHSYTTSQGASAMSYPHVQQGHSTPGYTHLSAPTQSHSHAATQQGHPTSSQSHNPQQGRSTTDRSNTAIQYRPPTSGYAMNPPVFLPQQLRARLTGQPSETQYMMPTPSMHYLPVPNSPMSHGMPLYYNSYQTTVHPSQTVSNTAPGPRLTRSRSEGRARYPTGPQSQPFNLSMAMNQAAYLNFSEAAGAFMSGFPRPSSTVTSQQQQNQNSSSNPNPSTSGS